MIMKHHTSILTILGLATLLAACSEDILDIENKNALTLNDYYTTAEHAEQAVVACYDAIKSNGLYGLRLTWVSIAMGDFGVYEKPIFEELIYTPDDESVKFIYGYAFRGVAKCNLALEKIAGITDPLLTDDLRDRMYGEIRFLRAMYNFILHTRFYEPPLITSTIGNMQATFGNATWEEFLTQIEHDLLGYEDEDGEFIHGAVDLLPEIWDDENVGRATSAAAYALMGKTYLYHNKWAEAVENFREVVDMGIYELIQPQGTDPKDFIYAFMCNFSSEDLTHKDRTYRAENNIESIFSIQFASTDFVRTPYLPGWMCDGHILNAYNGINGWRNTAVSQSYVDMFAETPGHVSGIDRDPRLYGAVYTAGDTITNDRTSDFFIPFDPAKHQLSIINTGYAIKKGLYPLHETGEAPFNAPHDWRLIRYSDVLLMLAEAEYHLNGSTDLAVDALNQVRERAGLEPLEQITADDIVRERACECGLEGERFWDLVRWGRIGGEWPTPEDHIPGFITGRHEFFPIPTIEISKMQGALKQNPGW